MMPIKNGTVKRNLEYIEYCENLFNKVIRKGGKVTISNGAILLRSRFGGRYFLAYGGFLVYVVKEGAKLQQLVHNIDGSFDWRQV